MTPLNFLENDVFDFIGYNYDMAKIKLLLMEAKSRYKTL